MSTTKNPLEGLFGNARTYVMLEPMHQLQTVTAAFKLKFLDGFAFLLADASEFFSLGDLSELPNE